MILSRLAVMPLKAPMLTLRLSEQSFKGPTVFRAFKTDAKLFNENNRHFVRRARERIGLKDRAMGPTSGAPFQIGIYIWIYALYGLFTTDGCGEYN